MINDHILMLPRPDEPEQLLTIEYAALRKSLGALVLIYHNENFRSTVAETLSRESGWELVGSFQSVEAALPFLQTGPLEMLMIELDDPAPSFDRSLELLRTVQPEAPFLLVADGARPLAVLDTLRFGAGGYLLKEDVPDRLCLSLREMKNKGFPLSSSLVNRLIHELQPRAVTHPGFAMLTERERECLELLAKGRLYKEIAADLGIGMETVRTYIKRLFVKLDVNTRTEAAVRLFSDS